MALTSTIYTFDVRLADTDRSVYQSLSLRVACHPSETEESLLTGAWRAWIDVGSPDAARLHRASKRAPRVVVYTHKDPATLVRNLAGERIHRASELEIHAMDRGLLAALVERLDRRLSFDLTVTGGHLFITLGAETLTGEVVRIRLPG
jgi:uncharacterized protein YaeQ